mgnify:CR=1 FL=1
MSVEPNVTEARSLLGRALRELAHCEGKTKQAQRSVDEVRKLVAWADRELSGEDPRQLRLELPAGAVEGRSNIRKGDWVR